MPDVFRPAAAPLPDLILYHATSCHLCDDARDAIAVVVAERTVAGLRSPRVIERDVMADPVALAAFFDTIPVVEIGDRRLPLATSVSKLRRLVADVIDRDVPDVTGSGVTLLVALGAGLLSFLSPCVLPLVPAYLGQLTVVAVAAGEARADGRPSRWVAVRHAFAYVAGFGIVFTLLGITATFFPTGALQPLLPLMRQIGGVVLIVMGLNLAGLLTIPVLERTWRPLQQGASSSLAAAGGTISLGTPGPGGSPSRPGRVDRFAGRLVTTRNGWVASFGLGVIFAIGWTPCIGIILGAILTLAGTSGSQVQGALLLGAYTLGLGLPFIALAVVYDRAPAVVRPLVRHGRAVSFVGGLLVVAIGVAMLMDWLSLVPRYIPINTGV